MGSHSSFSAARSSLALWALGAVGAAAVVWVVVASTTDSAPPPVVPTAATAELAVRPPQGPGRRVGCPAISGGKDKWTFGVEVSDSEGLVITDLRFGPRLVARRISVAYLVVNGTVGHLSVAPMAGDPDLTSVLVGDVQCANDGRSVSATYRVSSLFQRRSFLVRQVYAFADFRLDERCEASGTAKCVRFWPSVYWALEGSSGDGDRAQDLGFDLVQRFDFDPDYAGSGAADLVKDVITAGTQGPHIQHLANSGRLLEDDAKVAIADGGVVEWENWHQTGRASVGLPGVHNIPEPPYVGRHAGCSECAHAHWSWFSGTIGSSSSNLNPDDRSADWSDGRPQILDGSHQTACIGWTAATRADQQVDWCARATAEPDWAGPTLTKHDRPVMFWQTRFRSKTAVTSQPQQAGSEKQRCTGADRRDRRNRELRKTAAGTSDCTGILLDATTYRIGDAAWPVLPNAVHGGDGSMFVVPARRLQTVGRALDPGKASIRELPGRSYTATGERLPSGWVVPVVLNVGGADEKGPYYLRVHSHDAAVLNNESNDRETTAWVTVYDDPVPTDDDAAIVLARPGRPVTVMTQGTASPASTDHPPVGQPPRPTALKPMVAHVAFDQEPAPGSTSYQLDAAPNGVEFYQPSTGVWDWGEPPSDLSGEQYAYLTKVDPARRTVTFDLVDWFWDDEATKACKEDGIKIPDSAWCTSYYYRNRNPKLRTMPVVAGADIKGVSTDPSYREVPLTMEELRTWPTTPHRPFKLYVREGVLTRVTEVFLP